MSFQTSSGLIQGIIPFDVFVSKVKQEWIASDTCTVEFSQCVKNEHFSEADLLGDNRNFIRSRVKTHHDFLKMMRWEVFKSAKIRKINNMTMPMLVEEMSLESCLNYGTPEWVVDLGDNMFLMVQLSDYIVYCSSEGKALAVLSKPRCTIFHMSKFDNSKYAIDEEDWLKKLSKKLSK